MILLLFWIAVATLTAIAANAKNRSPIEGFIVGALFSVIGLIGYLVAKPSPSKRQPVQEGLLVNSSGERQCPHCGELIRMEASKCKHCMEAVQPITREEASAAHDRTFTPMRQRRTLIVCAIGVAVVAASYFYQT